MLVSFASLRSANSTTIKCRRKKIWGSSRRKWDTNNEHKLCHTAYNCMPYDIMCIHRSLYTFIIVDSARGREQNVKRCRCLVSRVRNKCINNRAHSPRTCWRPRCLARGLCHMNMTCLPVKSTRQHVRSTHPVRQPPERRHRSPCTTQEAHES